MQRLFLRGGWQPSLDRVTYLIELVRFAARLLALASTRQTYNPAVRDVVARQIYFTAWEVLPRLALFSVLLTWLIGSIAAEVARPFGLQIAAAELVLRVVALEGVPLVVALLLALRSGAAMNAEVALMSQRGESAAWQRLGLNPEQLEYMPRLVGGLVSMLAMTLLCVMLSVGFLVASLYHSASWQVSGLDIRILLGNVLSVGQLGLLVIKAILFGLVVTVIPLFEGQRTSSMPHMVPISVLRGMVRVFAGLMLVWLTGIAWTYL